MTDIDSTIRQLTVEEKAALTSGATLWTTKPVPRLGVPAITMSDGPHGLRRQPDGGDHLGIGHSRPATCFPPAVALGSSWDPELLERVGAALGKEAAALDVNVVLGPGINIKRSPLCGRNFEYLSEDPRLSGVLGAALIDGIQSQGVGASLKHFAANNQETERLRVSADVDERTLRELYLAGFEHAVTAARPWTVMCSYNRLNGVYTSEHPWLLTDVLRGDWGFEGVVVSDWGAVNDRVAALQAGLDLEMPTSGGTTDADIVAAVCDGQVDPAVLDRSVGRLLALVDKTTAGARPDATFDVEEHHRLAREVAGQCVVLLRNDGALPLEPRTAVAVVGELARTPRYQGAGSSHIVPTRRDDALSEMRMVAGSDLPFAAGYRLDAPQVDGELVDEARALAASSAVTLVFCGLPEGEESEGYDRAHIDLPANQLAVLDAVAATGTRVVVVLSNGGVVAVSGWEHRTAAIVEGWLLGQAGGGAVADVLYGVVNPSGRLAETIPVRLQDTASYLNFPGELGHVRYGEGVFVGYRHHDAVNGDVSYPFGHGLSYTTFAYHDLEVVAGGRDEDLRIEVTVRVENTGARAGREVVQLYVGAPSEVVRRPARELRAFRKIGLEPGESAVVAFRLGFRDVAYFHPLERRWVAEPGVVTVSVGASSRDLRLAVGVEIDATPHRPPLTPDSPLADWVATSDGLELLRREMPAPAGTGLSYSRFLSDANLKTMGFVPVRRLARYPGAHVDSRRLEELAATLNGGRSDPGRAGNAGTGT